MMVVMMITVGVVVGTMIKEEKLEKQLIPRLALP